ncbi:MAG: UDP-N-acetylmuramyl pentapeptide phosphotransferase/UDP-N-acetylglucosamine-1-phosphate transferase [Myxococcota bacterium]
MNMFDNSDGAAGTVALVVTIGLACTAAVLGRLDYALLCGAYTGALAAFLHFNRYPSRIFMGDIGSFQLATFLGGTTIALTWTEGTLDSALQSNLFFLVLFLDVALVSVYRISQNISPFRGDTSHLSHVLIEQLQSPRRWVKILGLLTGALTGAYLLLAHGSLVGPPRDAVLLLAWLLPTAALTAAYLRGLRQRRALAQPPLQRRGYTG